MTTTRYVGDYRLVGKCVVHFSGEDCNGQAQATEHHQAMIISSSHNMATCAGYWWFETIIQLFCSGGGNNNKMKNPAFDSGQFLVGRVLCVDVTLFGRLVTT